MDINIKLYNVVEIQSHVSHTNESANSAHLFHCYGHYATELIRCRDTSRRQPQMEINCTLFRWDLLRALLWRDPIYQKISNRAL